MRRAVGSRGTSRSRGAGGERVNLRGKVGYDAAGT